MTRCWSRCSRPAASALNSGSCWPAGKLCAVLVQPCVRAWVRMSPLWRVRVSAESAQTKTALVEAQEAEVCGRRGAYQLWRNCPIRARSARPWSVSSPGGTGQADHVRPVFFSSVASGLVGLRMPCRETSTTFSRTAPEAAGTGRAVSARTPKGAARPAKQLERNRQERKRIRNMRLHSTGGLLRENAGMAPALTGACRQDGSGQAGDQQLVDAEAFHVHHFKPESPGIHAVGLAGHAA